MKNEYPIIDKDGNDAVADLGKGAKKFKIAICYEVGATMTVKANSEEEAQAKLKDILDYSGLSELENDPTFETVAREYWAQDIEEIQV